MGLTYLDRILGAHRAQAAADERPLGPLLDRALGEPPARPFVAALAPGHPGHPGNGVGPAVIAEFKRRSPSLGTLGARLDPAEIATQYRKGGAACLSVLTDADFFGGSPGDLVEARAASGLPTLRKDFTVDRRDLCDARLMGADAVLLIVAALDQAELADLMGLARRLGLAALVEVHDEAEVGRAVRAGAEVIGVNQRDLVTFEVDGDRAERLRPLIPDGVVAVAESGIRTSGDAHRLAGAGYDAVLVGESLMRATDRAGAVTGLRTVGAPRCS